MKKDDCIFCKLANGEIPTNTVYEDDLVMAILDNAPATKGHTLVIPKEHFADLFEMSQEEAAEVMKRVRKVADLLKEKLTPDGMNLMQNNGEVAGQTVRHFHMHLIPRYLSDPPHVNFNHAPEADPAALKVVLEEIRK